MPVIINRIKGWLAQRRLNKAIKILREFGLIPVRIVHKANTDYLVAMDGTHYRIGGKEKKK